MSEMAMINALDKAVSSHNAWKVRLRMAIMQGNSELQPAEVQCDDKCAFGKWLYGANIPDGMKSEMPYQVVRRLHAEFHERAARVLSLALSDRATEATALMATDFDEQSQRLQIAIAKWKRELVQMEAAA